MIDERQFQIGGSCTYHTTTTIDMINISLDVNFHEYMYIEFLTWVTAINPLIYKLLKSEW
jgi:hypothetical protein